MIRGVLLKTVEKISLRRVAMNLSKNFQMVQALFFLFTVQQETIMNVENRIFKRTPHSDRDKFLLKMHVWSSSQKHNKKILRQKNTALWRTRTSRFTPPNSLM